MPQTVYLSDHCTQVGTTNYYYITDIDPSGQKQYLEALTSSDTLIINRHVGLAVPNIQDAASSLTLECNVVLTQQGSFILLQGVAEDGLELNGYLSAPQNAQIFDASGDYPGGFFRFDTLDQSTRQVIIRNCQEVNAKWFGLPNTEGQTNRNAWLLRKALLAAEDARIPVYIPPGEYTFDDPIFSSGAHPITLHGAKSGQSIVTLAGGIRLIEMEGESTSNRLKGVSVRHLNFVGDDFDHDNQPIILQLAEDVDISSCRFENLLRSIQTKSVYNCRATENSSKDIRSHCFYMRHAEVSDGLDSEQWFGSTNVIVRNNKFVRCPKNVSLTSNRAVIFNAYRNPDDMPLNVQIAERHKACMTAHNHFSDQRCTAVSMIAIIRSFLANGNIIEMVEEEFTQNEPMTVGGNWQERTNDVLSADQAGGKEFLYGMNNITNERNNAGSVLLHSQGESALFWANQILGGGMAFYVGFSDSESRGFVRIQRNVHYTHNNTRSNVEGKKFAFMGQTNLTREAESSVKNVVFNLNSLDVRAERLLGYVGEDDFRDDVRVVQGWQPAYNLDDPEDPAPVTGSKPYSPNDIMRGVLELLPDHVYSAYAKANSHHQVAHFGQLAFVDMDDAAVTYRFGSYQVPIEDPPDPPPPINPSDGGFVGLSAVHEPIGQINRGRCDLICGAPTIISSALLVMTGVVTAASGSLPARADLVMPNAAWNTGLLKLEDQYLWIRGDGHIAVKEQSSPPTDSPPVNDNDGSIIPIQAEGVSDVSKTATWSEIATSLNSLLKNLRDASVIAA